MQPRGKCHVSAKCSYLISLIRSSDIFRPFRGFKSVRLIPREKGPDEKVILCFADFENALQTTIVINTLQGYRFDKDDIWGLQFSYANKQTNEGSG